MKMRSSTALLGIPDLPEEAFKHIGDRKIKPQGDSGGGGGGQPSTTTQTTELPEWARPYAKNLLAKGSALTDINQNPYQQYGGNRIAGFSPMQMQSFQNAGNMDAGPQGFQQQVGQYMSPYMQNVVDVEKRGAIRDYQIGNTMQQAQATQAGAFGGGREALQRAERERGLMGTLGTIQAQGSQAAYDQASNQFRQGIQQNLAVNQLQNQYGGQMQQQAQRPLDMAYQDFQNQQNYPYKQLGFMSDLVRGLPLGQKSTSAVYDQGPGMVQTLAGLGGAAYGFGKSGLFGAKEGGLMDSYAYGGVTSQDNKNRIVDDMYSMDGLQKAKEAALARHDVDTANAIDERVAELNALQAQNASIDRGLGSAFDQIPQDQQEQMMAGGGIVAFAKGGDTYGKKFEDSLVSLQDMANQQPAPVTPEQYEQGVTARQPMLEKLYGEDATKPYLEETKAKRTKLADQMEKDKWSAFAMASLGMLARKRTPGESQSNQLISGIGEAGQAFIGQVGQLKKENRDADDKLRQSEILLATAQQQRKEGMVNKAMALEDKAEAQKQDAFKTKIGVQEKVAQLQSGMAGHEMQAQSAKDVAGIHGEYALRTAKIAATHPTDLDKQAEAIYAAKVAQDPSIASDPKRSAQTRADARQDAASQIGRYPGDVRASIAQQGATEKQRKDAEASVENTLLSNSALRSQYRQLQAEDKKNQTNSAEQFREGLIQQHMQRIAAPQQQPAPVVPGGTGTPSRGGPQPAPAPQLSAIDQQALQWAQSNPKDPRAAAIRQRLGMGG